VTTLTSITWQLGRTGALVPVAELAPVAVAGVSVARASLHNVQVARRLGVRVGDAVVVRRAGDVVPQVVGPVLKMRTGRETEWETPSHCPACGSALVGGSDADGDVLRCAARGCPGRSLKRVQHFAACVASDGVGPSTVAAIVDAGLASDAADLVALTAADLATLPRFGALRAAAVSRALAAAFTAPPAAVLAGLAIPGVGPAVADALLARFGSVRALADAAARGGVDVASVRGVGPAIAAELERWFAVDDNVALVDRLLGAGVGGGHVERVEAAPTGGGSAAPPPLAGLSIVVTGTLPSLSRSAAHAAIKAAGGTPSSAVSARTAGGVVGDGPGKAKLAAAESAGVRVVPAAIFSGASGVSDGTRTWGCAGK
jgi:DNA ligase (NAD+)